MKVYEGSDIRNIALIGHGHSGKTTLTSGFLYTAGATNRLTRVDEGNAITDFDDEEVQRKITISTFSTNDYQDPIESCSTPTYSENVNVG